MGVWEKVEHPTTKFPITRLVWERRQGIYFFSFSNYLNVFWTHIFVRSPENDMQKQPTLNSHYLIQNNLKWDSNFSKCFQHEFLQTAKLQPAAAKLFVHIKLKHFVTERHTVPFHAEVVRCKGFREALTCPLLPWKSPREAAEGTVALFFFFPTDRSPHGTFCNTLTGHSSVFYFPQVRVSCFCENFLPDFSDMFSMCLSVHETKV